MLAYYANRIAEAGFIALVFAGSPEMVLPNPESRIPNLEFRIPNLLSRENEIKTFLAMNLTTRVLQYN